MRKFVLMVAGIVLVGFILTGCSKRHEHVVYEGEPVAVDTFNGRITAIDHDPVGSNLALGFSDSLILIWDVQSSRPVRRIEKHRHIINDLAYSPSGEVLAAAGADEVLTIHDLKTGKLIDSVAEFNGSVTSVDFSSDGAFLAVGYTSSLVEVWDAEAWERFGKFDEHIDVVTRVRFRPGTHELYTSGRDSFFFIVDINEDYSFKSKFTYGYVNSIAFADDGTLSATGGTNNLIKIWRTDPVSSVGWYQSDLGNVLGIVFTSDHANIFAVDQNGQVVVLERTASPDTVKIKGMAGGVFRVGIVELGVFQAHDAPIRACAISRDGSRLYTGGDDKLLKTWDVKAIISELKAKAEQ